MLRTIGTEVSQLCVVILEQSIAAAARALTKDKVTDFVNYGVHWIPRANYQSNFDAIERKAAFRGDNLFVSPNGSRDMKFFFGRRWFPEFGKPGSRFPENEDAYGSIQSLGWLG